MLDILILLRLFICLSDALAVKPAVSL